MIPEILLQGDHYQMGLQFGKAYRQPTQEFANIRLQRIQDSFKEKLAIELSPVDILNYAEQTLLAHESYDPFIWQEFCGIAKGAELTHSQLLVAMSYTDLVDFIAVSLANEQTTSECSAFLIPADNSVNATPLCGQTWDMHTSALPYLVLVRRKPSNGDPETVYLTTAGCLGLIGINSAGLAIGTTNLSATDAKPGVNYLFTITKALRAENITDAKESVIDTSRLSGHDFYLADQQTVINMETTANLSYITKPSKKNFVITNHYLNNELARYHLSFDKEFQVSTEYRLQKMQQNFIKDKKKLWDMETCWQAISDDTRNEAGNAVSNDDYEQRYGDSATLATCVMSPAEKTLWVCSGVGKTGEKQVLTLD